jgi:hypothetical protein
MSVPICRYQDFSYGPTRTPQARRSYLADSIERQLFRQTGEVQACRILKPINLIHEH